MSDRVASAAAEVDEDTALADAVARAAPLVLRRIADEDGECIECGGLDRYDCTCWDDDYDDDPDDQQLGDDIDDYEPGLVPHPRGHRGLCRCDSYWDHADLTYRHNSSARGRRAARRQAIQRERRRDAEHRRVMHRIDTDPNYFPF